MENITSPTVVQSAPDSVKFTEEETKEITEIRTGFDQAIVAFGRVHLQRLGLDKVEVEMKKEYEVLEKQEKDFFQKIVAKYGEGNYDPATNVFTPAPKKK